MIEQEVRLKIDQMLRNSGWIIDPEHAERNVYVENALKPKLTRLAAERLGNKKPDYTFFHRGRPIAVLEAKKEGATLDKALAQGVEYAEKLEANIVFAFNGRKLQSLHIPTRNSLYYNDMEVSSFPQPDKLAQYHDENSNKIRSASEQVITSRDQLISLISTWNDLLRSSGMRSGVERFTEFANILFLKLLSEAESDDGLWGNLLKQDEHRIVSYVNGFVIKQLEDRYGSEVISETKIADGRVLRRIVLELNSLSLSSVDEDVKGLAFEHFIQKTTTQNDLGEYFTPRHIVRFMVKLVDPEFGHTVFDPFCGTGGFLVESYRHLSQKSGRSPTNTEILQTKTIFGQEITSNARIAKMNMILFGDGHSGVTQTNSITNSPEREYNVVLSNIPFSQKLPDDEIRMVDSSALDADEACLLRCFNSLSDGGSMAVVIPEGLVVKQES
ncbi:N-6 DNA methylase [Candidatus Poriferisocius sp.]|uniref:HsdM family class I SAM-dependent methyltransferase n=1 Tax=Candidatus Poriferisocius sp. TaxID=3101276 RepID=UPI003B0216F8